MLGYQQTLLNFTLSRDCNTSLKSVGIKNSSNVKKYPVTVNIIFISLIAQKLFHTFILVGFDPPLINYAL